MTDGTSVGVRRSPASGSTVRERRRTPRFRGSGEQRNTAPSSFPPSIRRTTSSMSVPKRRPRVRDLQGAGHRRAAARAACRRVPRRREVRLRHGRRGVSPRPERPGLRDHGGPPGHLAHGGDPDRHHQRRRTARLGGRPRVHRGRQAGRHHRRRGEPTRRHPSARGRPLRDGGRRGRQEPPRGSAQPNELPVGASPQFASRAASSARPIAETPSRIG